KSPWEKDSLLLPLANWIRAKKQSGYLTILVCNTRSQADRLKSLLAPYGIQPEAIAGFPHDEQHKGCVCVCCGQISGGFVWPDQFLAIITDDEIFGTKHRRRRKSRETAPIQLLSFEDLKQGDLVVHDEHGIGRYEGLVKLNLNGSTND
ncbi:transcription-repair coupling factor, partial [Desulfobacteraceae bacterium SEEP-SAG9]